MMMMMEDLTFSKFPPEIFRQKFPPENFQNSPRKRVEDLLISKFPPEKFQNSPRKISRIPPGKVLSTIPPGKKAKFPPEKINPPPPRPF